MFRMLPRPSKLLEDVVKSEDRLETVVDEPRLLLLPSIVASSSSSSAGAPKPSPSNGGSCDGRPVSDEQCDCLYADMASSGSTRKAEGSLVRSTGDDI